VPVPLISPTRSNCPVRPLRLIRTPRSTRVRLRESATAIKETDVYTSVLKIMMLAAVVMHIKGIQEGIRLA
jgi:hypothetical protein